jgi:MFS family permease
VRGLRKGAGRTFDALHVFNYRIYFFGQIVSLSGTWMQIVAQAWLVLKLTGSGVALGAVIAVQTLPILIAGAWGGVIADRVDKRKLLIGTQIASATLALTLGLLTATGVIRLWMVFVLAAGLGCVNFLDNPTRQAFVTELVGPERLTNAISLNSVVINGARIIGPAFAGLLIATVGIAPSFLLNAASFVPVIIGFGFMRRSELKRSKPTGRHKGQLVAGFRYVWSTPELRTPLLMMAVVGTLAYEFTVTLPLMARFGFHAGPAAFGLMSSFMGAGAVVGGLITATLGPPNSRRLLLMATLFGLAILVTAVAPTLWAEFVSLTILGAFSISFIATANTTLQLSSAPEMRGRVMALYSVAFLGSTPIGGPLVGWIGGTLGPRQAVGVGGVATLVAVAFALRPLLGRHPARLRGGGLEPRDSMLGAEAMGEAGGLAGAGS